MSVRDFDARFGIKASVEEEKRRFVTRIETSLFPWLYSYLKKEAYISLFSSICYELGVDPTGYAFSLPLGGQKEPRLIELTLHDFTKTLRTLVALYHCIYDDYLRLEISSAIQAAMRMSSSDLGIQWSEEAGIFYPTGEAVLDEQLIGESLKSLDSYPNEQRDISIALQNYQAKRLDGVIENCYLAVEGLSRIILNNGKTLLNNKQDLLQTLRFSKYWGNTLSSYIEYANEYRRHAGDQRHDLNPIEVEAYLYLTCLIIRAIVRGNTENPKALSLMQH